MAPRPRGSRRADRCGKAAVKAGADPAVTIGQIAEHAPQQPARLLAACRVVAREQLRAQQPAALRPRADQRLVGQLALVVHTGTGLVAAIDLDPGRVEIERHLRARRPAELGIHAVRASRECRLGRAQMRPSVSPRELARCRRRRHLGHRAQLRARRIATQPLEIEHRVTATEHRVSHRHQQLPRRTAPRTLLDRGQSANPRRRLDRPIQRRDQLQTAHQLADDHRSTERRQRPIVGHDLDPRRLTETVPRRPPLRAPLTPGL
jgi:hypothetical protein